MTAGRTSRPPARDPISGCNRRTGRRAWDRQHETVKVDHHSEIATTHCSGTAASQVPSSLASVSRMTSAGSVRRR